MTYATGTRNADFSFTNMFAWSRDYALRVCDTQDFLLGEVIVDGLKLISYPLGVSDDNQLREIITELRTMYAPLRMSGLSQEHVDNLARLFPDEFTVSAHEAISDYLYDIEKLTTLSGKKLHAKRNYINRLETEFPQWVFEPLTESNVDECLMADGLWLFNKSEDYFDTIPGEVHALQTALTNFTELNLDGGLIRLAPGEPVAAFTAGERLSADTYVTHFEKALPGIDGAYQLVNREFARMIKAKFPEVCFINREEDMGIENLRKSKRSYYPELMEVKYKAIFN